LRWLAQELSNGGLAELQLSLNEVAPKDYKEDFPQWPIRFRRL
jgi:hypothetical protein